MPEYQEKKCYFIKDTGCGFLGIRGASSVSWKRGGKKGTSRRSSCDGRPEVMHARQTRVRFSW